MPFPTLTVGTITIIPLSDGAGAASPTDMMPSVPAENWKAVSEYLDADGMIRVNFGSFLIREGDTWTLVDTGFGNRPDSRGGALFGELQKAEVRPDQISRVILTHLHGDHLGGNTVDVDGQPVPTFKNARYVVQRADWGHFQQPQVKQGNPGVALCADPIEAAGLLDLIDGSRSISAGISTILTPGHTPGHQSILVSSGDEKAIILGDVSHTPVQILHPDWSPGFDVDPSEASRTRRAVFDRIEREGLRIAAGHYPYPGLGGIVRVEGKRRWQPLS
ncbi:MAG TPA: MBL fold metallo-hydrolase [Chloroflexota bacterium]|nr:MBL fold metallo-hydrolase [Chloroflexota bacterium]